MPELGTWETILIALVIAICIGFVVSFITFFSEVPKQLKRIADALESKTNDKKEK